MIEPGRELDKLVAEKVMGLEVVKDRYGELSLGPPDWYDDHGCMELINPVPNYSEDIADAWQVLEKICEIHKARPENQNKYIGYNYYPCLKQAKDGLWGFEFVEIGYDNYPYPEFYSTAPHAICIAALSVMGVEV